jgi:type IV secretory pathway VirB9-like protein
VKLNHSEFINFIANSARDRLPLKPEDGNGMVNLNVITDGKKQTFELTISTMRYYSDMRYMWE